MQQPIAALLLIAGLLTSLAQPAPGQNSPLQDQPPPLLLVPYLCGEKYGFADRDGGIKIACEFDEVDFFDTIGLAPVRKADKWAVIDQTGHLVIGFDFLQKPYIACSFYLSGEAGPSGDYSDDERGKLPHLVLIMDREFRKWAVFNRRDGYCSGLKYADWFEAFSDGPRNSLLRGGAFVNRPSKHLFQEGLLSACISINSSVFLDTDGRETDGTKLKPASGPAPVRDLSAPKKIPAPTGEPEQSLPPTDPTVDVPLPPVFLERHGAKYRLTDKNGKALLRREFDNAGQTNVGGIAYACDSIGLVEKEIGCPPVRRMVTLYRCGLVNAAGTFVVPMEYESAYAWNTAFWETARRDAEGREVHSIFDNQGKLLFEKVCSDIYPLNLKYLQVTENGKRYLVDAAGKVLIDRGFDDIRELGSINQGLFQSWEGNYRNLINLKGEILASYSSQEEYDSPVDNQLSQDRIIFNFGKEHFIIDNQGNIICRDDFEYWDYADSPEQENLLKVSKQSMIYYIDIASGRVFKD